MENDVHVQAINYSVCSFWDGAYPIFDVQAYLAEHQKLMDEYKDFLCRVSILEYDMRTLKENSKENI